MLKFIHKKTQQEYAAEQDAEERERKQAIAAGDNEAEEIKED